jgi:hypothetical protein
VVEALSSISDRTSQDRRLNCSRFNGRAPGQEAEFMAGRFITAFKDTLRVLRTFVHEVIGGFFLALAIIGGTSVVQELRRYTADAETGIWRIGLAGIFSLAMLAFGLHSFWKARKIQK